MESAEIRRVQFRACPEAMLRLMENHPRGTFLMRCGTITGVPRLPIGTMHYIRTGVNTNFSSIDICLDVLSFAKEAWKFILSELV